MPELHLSPRAERDALLAEKYSSTAGISQERDKLRLELTNFLRAFDTYFGVHNLAHEDAKQAMFSAANQAREALEGK